VLCTKQIFRTGPERPASSASHAQAFLVHVFADGGYAGEKLEKALAKNGGPAIEIVKRPDDAKGFVLVARRWAVERTLAWVNRCRRLAKDWEATTASSEAWLIIASIRQLSRRIARNIK
jgi:transposase